MTSLIEVKGFKRLEKGSQRGDMREVGGLLALHGGDQHLVQHGELLRVLLLVGLDPLGHEVLRDDVLDFRRVCFLVRHPSRKLVVIDRIRLAGAFGAHIDVKYAMVLGMIPDCTIEQVSSAGNAAGTGARIALLDKSSRDEIRDVTRKVEKIETAVEERFQHHFVAAMAIPHDTDPFPRLQEVVTLPARKTTTQTTARRRRRR